MEIIARRYLIKTKGFFLRIKNILIAFKLFPSYEYAIKSLHMSTLLKALFLFKLFPS